MATGFPTKANWAAGDVLTASALDDLAGTVNLLSNASAATGSILVSNAAGTSFVYQGSMAAGKNICINGGFDIWQRGTSFTTFVYTADRWKMNPGGTVTVSQDTDVPTGVGVRYSLKQLTSASSSFSQYQMGFEQATTIPMRNQVYTFSFYMKANATWSNTFSPQIYYSNSSDTLSTIMSGTLVTATGNTAPTPTTSWVRYSVTFTVPSDAVGIGVYFAPAAAQASGAALWIAGCQWEIGSVATAFTRSGGTIQGELAACQRYYYRATNSSYGAYAMGTAYSSSAAYIPFVLPVTMRTIPTSVEFPSTVTNLKLTDIAANNATISALSMDSSSASQNIIAIIATSSGMTTNKQYWLTNNNSTTGFVGVNAEL